MNHPTLASFAFAIAAPKGAHQFLGAALRN
jgi:hypothetical protein